MEHEIHIWHDRQGRIIAWGHAGNSKIKVEPLAKANHRIITAHVAENDLPKLHETHRVDSKTKRLIQKNRPR